MSEYTDKKREFYAANPTYWSLSFNDRWKLLEKAGFNKASRCMELCTETGKDSLWQAHANCGGFCKTLSAEELDRELQAKAERIAKRNRPAWYSRFPRPIYSVISAIVRYRKNRELDLYFRDFNKPCSCKRPIPRS